MMLGSQSAKNSKSQAVLKQHKDTLSALPYDNFLKNKSVHVAALSKRPKDRKVMLEIEKLNGKKQEREYKKYLEEQVKQFKDQR